MAGDRKLTARQNAARPEARPAHKPMKNYKPAFESIMNTGKLSAAPEKLVAAMKNLMSSAKERGVEKEVTQLLSNYASLGNNIVLLTLKRLDNLVNTAPEGQLRQKLGMAKTLMTEFQDAADTIPALLSGSKRVTSCDKLDLNSMRKVLRRGIGRSKSLCPKEISNTIKSEMESGRMDDIQGVTEFRQEVQGFQPQPAIADLAPEVHTQQLQTPQPATQDMPTPAQATEDRTDVPLMAQEQALRTPAQRWEEDVKLLDGPTRRRDPMTSSVREKAVESEPTTLPLPRRFKPSTAPPASQFRKAGLGPETVLFIKVLCASHAATKKKPAAKTPAPKREQPAPQKTKAAEKTKPEAKVEKPKPAAKEVTPKPASRKAKKPFKKTPKKAEAKKDKKPKKKTPKKMAKKPAPPKKKAAKKKPMKKPPRKKKPTAKVKAAPRQPKRGKKPKKGPLAKKRKMRGSRRKNRKALRAAKAVKKRKRKNSTTNRVKAKSKRKKPSVKARKASLKKAKKMRVKAFRTKKRKKRRRRAA